MKIWWHKLWNWEYWPVEVVYLPTFFLWIYFFFRFRSFSFYRFSNPSIKNGGLLGDSKFDIYSILPNGTYPRTLLINLNIDNDFENLLNESSLQFPLIVKPDVGCRGVNVQKVFSMKEIEEYTNKVNSPFLIQEICQYPNELGLFYCRQPGESKGKITGITLKKFLTVTGNGKDSICRLLQKNKRHEMQISKLSESVNLHEVLPLGETRCLVPFGNHNRGTEFLDGKELITDKLQETFYRLLGRVDGFYYGRLDIRYSTFKDLEQGKNFSIIELNGAKSEPTHIYDPKHSFWYGQKEIFRHQLLFSKIIHHSIRELNRQSDKVYVAID